LRKFGTSRPKGIPRTGLYQISNGAADEVTYRRNTEAYERCDLINVLAGSKIDMPLFGAPTALQLFHHDGERAVAKAAEKFGTMFGRLLPFRRSWIFSTAAR
jgi:L-lactate dehydrogenase (cytochrome)